METLQPRPREEIPRKFKRGSGFQSSQYSRPIQSNPHSSCGTPAQSLQKAVQAKPVTGVVKTEVSLSGGSIVGKPSRGQLTQAIKAQPLDTVQGPVW